MSDAPPVRPRKSKASFRKRRRIYMLIASMTAISLAVFLVLNALEDGIQLFKDPSEVMENKPPVGQAFRLGGLVKKGSFTKSNDGLVSYFLVTDGAYSIKVEFTGLLPDLFREGQGVVTEGALRADGTYIATRVLAKHDENYMPREVKESLEKRGLWKHGDEEPKEADQDVKPSQTTALQNTISQKTIAEKTLSQKAVAESTELENISPSQKSGAKDTVRPNPSLKTTASENTGVQNLTNDTYKLGTQTEKGSK